MSAFVPQTALPSVSSGCFTARNRQALQKPSVRRQCTVARLSSFQNASSVSFWATEKSNPQSNTSEKATNLVREVISSMGNSTQMAAYWFFTLRKTTYFTILKNMASSGVFSGSSSRISNVTDIPAFPNFVYTLSVLLDDAACIREGRYNFPWQYSLFHRESSPFHLAGVLADTIRDGLSNVAPRIRAGATGTPSWLRGEMYPDYYARSFHFQTDGWMTPESANLYEHTTETFFMGMQDAAQRVTLLGVSAALKSLRKVQPKHAARPNILEVGCGTGRFATTLRDNFPTARVTLSDASPFYLHKARENMTEWETFSAETRAKSNRGSVRFLQMRAEALNGIETGSVDVLISQYVLHELPPETRNEFVAEAARVIRPGGSFVLSEPLQTGELPWADNSLKDFTRFDEPYFESYASQDLVQLFTGPGGFECGVREMRGVSKVVTFTRVE